MRLRALAAVPLAVSIVAVAVAAAGSATPPREGRHELAAEGLGTQAWRNVYEPGEVAAMHEHPKPRYVVVISGGTLLATAPDGTRRRLELKTGQVVIRPAERHALENVGRTRIEVIEIEIP
ncbi:MAG: cupin domain-containing protein [Acidobacteria bacterium]|nr:MAG: cupin domain-containing protein [Acidobacteriota bacterium]